MSRTTRAERIESIPTIFIKGTAPIANLMTEAIFAGTCPTIKGGNAAFNSPVAAIQDGGKSELIQALKSVNQAIPSDGMAPISLEKSEAIRCANTDTEVIRALASTGAMVLAEKAEAFKSELTTLMASSGPVSQRVEAIKALGAVVVAGDNRIKVEAVAQVVAESCREIGFTPTTIDLDRGLVIGRQGAGGPILRVDVFFNQSQEIGWSIDADGFQGEACAHAVGKLEVSMKKKGLISSQAETRPKRHPNTLLFTTAVSRRCGLTR